MSVHFSSERQNWKTPKAFYQALNAEFNIEAQMAMVQTNMVKMEEVFLPYMQHKSGQTFFEIIEQNKFKMLEAPK